jgi:RNA polymerase sigma factor (sigma-70 family)
MRVCISPQDAEDATQETLLALSRHVGALRDVAALTGWLFKVVRRHCLRLARRSARRMLNLDEVQEPVAAGPTAEDMFVDDQLREQLAAVMAALEPGHREVLIRRDVQGQPAAEVAAAMGLSVEAVKSRLHRARKDVKDRLLARLRNRPCP